MGAHRLSERGQPAVQSGFRRPERQTERRGDRRQWQVEVVVEDDDDSLIGVEMAETLFDLVTRRTRDRAVLHRGIDEWGELNLHHPTSRPPQFVVTGSYQ